MAYLHKTNANGNGNGFRLLRLNYELRNTSRHKIGFSGVPVIKRSFQNINGNKKILSQIYSDVKWYFLLFTCHINLLSCSPFSRRVSFISFSFIVWSILTVSWQFSNNNMCEHFNSLAGLDPVHFDWMHLTYYRCLMFRSETVCQASCLWKRTRSCGAAQFIHVIRENFYRLILIHLSNVSPI